MSRISIVAARSETILGKIGASYGRHRWVKVDVLLRSDDVTVCVT